MKFFQKIRCFFAGHQPWYDEDREPKKESTNVFKVETKAFMLMFPAKNGWDGIEASVEVCPRCHSLWANVKKHVDDFNMDDIKKLLDKSKGFDFEAANVPKLPPEIECEFLDELKDETFKVKVVQRMNFIANYIEIESRDGKISAWELDAPQRYEHPKWRRKYSPTN